MALTNEGTGTPGVQDSYDQDSYWRQELRRVCFMWILNGWPQLRPATETSGVTVEGASANDAFDTELGWKRDMAQGAVTGVLEEPKMVNYEGRLAKGCLARATTVE